MCFTAWAKGFVIFLCSWEERWMQRLCGCGSRAPLGTLVPNLSLQTWQKPQIVGFIPKKILRAGVLTRFATCQKVSFAEKNEKMKNNPVSTCSSTPCTASSGTMLSPVARSRLFSSWKKNWLQPNGCRFGDDYHLRNSSLLSVLGLLWAIRVLTQRHMKLLNAFCGFSEAGLKNLLSDWVNFL